MITVDLLQHFIHSIDPNSNELEYVKILNSLDVYNQLNISTSLVERYTALKTLYQDINVYLQSYVHSPKNYFLQSLQLDCLIEWGQIYNRTLKPIQKQVIVSDLSSNSGDIKESYFNFWKTLNPEYTFKFFYDSEAFAANLMIDFFDEQTGISSIRELFNENKEIGEEHLELFSEKRIRKMYAIKKEIQQFFNQKRSIDSNIAPSQIVKEFLVTKYNYNPNNFELIRNEYINNYESMGAIDIRKNLPSIFNSLDASLYHIYEKELFTAFHTFDAGNILKFVLLNTFGGVSLDINYLPEIKDHIFANIPLSQYTPEEINRLKLIAIMSNKQYVEGYGPDDNIFRSELYDDLNDPIKQRIQQELDAIHHPSELFKSIGELSASELTFIADFQYSYSSVKSPLIAAHADSLATQTILSQIKTKYSIVEQVYNPIILENDSYNLARRAMFKFIQQTPNYDLKKFLLEIRYYMDSNFMFIDEHYLPSAYLTGNKMLLTTAKNIITFQDTISAVSTSQMTGLDFRGFLLLEAKATTSSELVHNEYGFEEKDNNDFEYYADIEGIDIRSDAYFIPGNPIDVDGFTQICNAIERFPYSKGYLSILLEVQDDAIVNKYLKIKFAKNAESSVMIQIPIDQESMYYFDPAIKQIVKTSISSGLPGHLSSFEKMKLTISGHGNGTNNTLGRMSPAELLTYISPTISRLKQMIPTMKNLEVNLLACKTLNLSSVQNSFSTQFLSLINQTNNPIKDLVNGVIENISVGTSPYTITMLDSRFALTFDDQMAYTREELALSGIIPKYLVQYEKGVLTLKPKQIKNSFEERNALEKAFKSTMEAAQLSNTNLDDLGVLFDHEDIAFSSVSEGQIRHRDVLSEVQKKSLELSDFLQIVEKVDQEIFVIKQANQLSEDYIAVLDSIEQRNGKSFIKFASKVNGEIKEIETPLKESFMEYKELSESKMRPVVEHITNLSNENFTYEHIDIHDTSHVSTLNAAFFVQILLEFVKSERYLNQLSTAVQVQLYTQMISTSLGLVTDAANVVKIISQAEQTTLQFLPKLVQAIQFLSFILDGINLGASIYTLINTEDEIEKKVLESSIGLTSVNFALGLGTTASYIAGASAAAEILGVLAVPIVGLTIGLGSLVNNLLKIEHDAEQIVKFFKMLGEVHRQGYYTLSHDKQTLYPNPVVPVTRIDFRYKNIKFGSIKISKTKGGSIVTDDLNPHYFAAPEPDNRGEGISITDVLFPENILQNILQNTTVILPNALNVRYYTDYNWVAGAGSWSGDGVTVLDRLRKHYDKNFHWRYYAAGGERAITTLEPVYEPTNVCVFCDMQDRTFISSMIEDKSVAKKLKYSIYYNKAKYTYVCQHTPIAVSFLPLDYRREYDTQINLKIDNLVYETKVENGKIIQESALKKLGDIIKIGQFKTPYKNVDLYGVDEHIKDTDILRGLEIKIGGQTVYFYGKTNENIFLSFRSKEFEVCLKVDFNKAYIDKIFVFGSTENFTTNKLSELSYLKNYNLPEYLLQDVQVVLNEGFNKNKNEPIIRGSVDIIKNEYVLVMEKEEGEQQTYTHVIKDFNLSADDIILESSNEQAVVLKKPRKVNQKESAITANNYILQGYISSKINGRIFDDLQHDSNQYIMEIIGKNQFVLKEVFLSRIFMMEVLSMLNGIPTIFDVFGFNTEVDPKTKVGRNKINAAVDLLIKNYCIKNAISLKNAERLNISFDSDMVLSGIDDWNRRLDFIFRSHRYILKAGYWSSDERDIDFAYNLLSQRELTVTKQQSARDQHTIEIFNKDLIFLNQYIENMVIVCDSKIELIEFNDINAKVMGIDNLKEINILLPVKSNSNSLKIKLPFLKRDLTWDTEGSNFIIEFLVNDVNKRITVLDVFHSNHLDKRIYISLKDEENLDILSFMEETV